MQMGIEDVALRAGGGSNVSEKSSPVTKGCFEACSAVHLMLGSRWRSPFTKWVNAFRLLSSEMLQQRHASGHYLAGFASY